MSEREQIEDAARRAFPDLPEGPLTLRDLRAQSLGALRSAVSLDVFRSFPQTNVEDADARHAYLRAYERRLMEHAEIEPVNIRDEDAAGVVRSAHDLYGPSLQDLKSLSDYGFRKEWELGKSMGETYDVYGVPYGDSYEDWCLSTNALGKSSPAYIALSDEFASQLSQYDRVIYEATGKPPVADRSMEQMGIAQVPLTEVAPAYDAPETVHYSTAMVEPPPEPPEPSLVEKGAASLGSAMREAWNRKQERDREERIEAKRRGEGWNVRSVLSDYEKITWAQSRQQREENKMNHMRKEVLKSNYYNRRKTGFFG